MSRLADKLKEFRGEEAQGVFAARLGLKQAVYCHYEKGRREPSLDQLAHIAAVLQTTTDNLLGISSEVLSHGAGSALIPSACRPSHSADPPPTPGSLPQCSNCPHRKLAEKMRKMLGGG